ncbi:hypothetical protein D9757_005636 [Collybiopsis confluens]|uniref:Dipeptidase n=1 Tax=Collybiopsis confluens TaxID=2823264 RepID=A0A8H5MCF1_9AGAR|nr:hypothetical protein D9757_005636 [Collybiopsis confluens]
MSERAPLLASDSEEHDARNHPTPFNITVRSVVWGILTVLTTATLVVMLFFRDRLPDGVKLLPWVGGDPRDPTVAALAILDKSPIIDGHIDLPVIARYQFANNVSSIDLNSNMPGHVDIPRLRKGKVGGFFWSVYVSCPDPKDEGKEFLGAAWQVRYKFCFYVEKENLLLLARDTLEQIDVAKLLIEKYPDTFQFARSSADIKAAVSNGKIAGLLGVEGAHQLGNSIAAVRQYYALGVRYITLTHLCHNAFADSCGLAPGKTPLHNGLSSFGLSLIEEMNRVGILVDLSHTSDSTAAQAIKHSKAPVIWSHSSARAIHAVPRNVPDEILSLIGTGSGQRDAVVMVNFAPYFVAPEGGANVAAVANHIEHISAVTGRQHVGIGSDYDGIEETPTGLEDVSKYPTLIAELYSRGWTQFELAGLAGGNFLRVFEGAERVSKELRAAGVQPVYDLYAKRTDIPH